MPNTVVIAERFPTWAAASEARNRLAHNGGFQRYRIEGANIDHIGSEFALMIHTDETHRDEIEHLLRPSGTMFGRPLEARPSSEPGLASPLLIFGLAVVTGGVLYSLLQRRYERSQEPEHWDDDLSANAERRSAGREDEQEWQHRQLESDQRAGLRSHAEGFAV